MNAPMIPVVKESEHALTVTSPAKINLWLEILGAVKMAFMNWSH